MSFLAQGYPFLYRTRDGNQRGPWQLSWASSTMISEKKYHLLSNDTTMDHFCVQHSTESTKSLLTQSSIRAKWLQLVFNPGKMQMAEIPPSIPVLSVGPLTDIPMRLPPKPAEVQPHWLLVRLIAATLKWHTNVLSKILNPLQKVFQGFCVCVASNVASLLSLNHC